MEGRFVIDVRKFRSQLFPGNLTEISETLPQEDMVQDRSAEWDEARPSSVRYSSEPFVQFG